jgi:hypothetical protein
LGLQLLIGYRAISAKIMIPVAVYASCSVR